MALEIIQRLRDDMDQTGDTDATGSHVLFLDGTAYNIDLSDANMAKLQRALSAYAKAANTTTEGMVVVPADEYAALKESATRGRPAIDRKQNKIIREWAEKQPGLELSDRGRIPQEIVDAFNAAQNGSDPDPLSQDRDVI